MSKKAPSEDGTKPARCGSASSSAPSLDDDKISEFVEAHPKRSPAETRALALAIQRHPIPHLSKTDLRMRWKVGTDTVASVLRRHDAYPGLSRDATISLTEILRCEGIADPVLAWALGTDADRTILQAGLLTLEELEAPNPLHRKFHIATLRRKARERSLKSIRIGAQHRVRPDLSDAETWLAAAARRAK